MSNPPQAALSSSPLFFPARSSLPPSPAKQSHSADHNNDSQQTEPLQTNLSSDTPRLKQENRQDDLDMYLDRLALPPNLPQTTDHRDTMGEAQSKHMLNGEHTGPDPSPDLPEITATSMQVIAAAETDEEPIRSGRKSMPAAAPRGDGEIESSLIAATAELNKESDEESIKTGRRSVPNTGPVDDGETESEESPIPLQRRKPVPPTPVISESSESDLPLPARRRTPVTPSRRQHRDQQASDGDESMSDTITVRRPTPRSKATRTQLKPSRSRPMPESTPAESDGELPPLSEIALLAAERGLPKYLRHANWLAEHIKEASETDSDDIHSPRRGTPRGKSSPRQTYAGTIPRNANDQFMISFQDDTHYHTVEVQDLFHRVVKFAGDLFRHARMYKIIEDGDMYLDLVVSKSQHGMKHGYPLVPESRFRISER